MDLRDDHRCLRSEDGSPVWHVEARVSEIFWMSVINSDVEPTSTPHCTWNIALLIPFALWRVVLHSGAVIRVSLMRLFVPSDCSRGKTGRRTAAYGTGDSERVSTKIEL